MSYTDGEKILLQNPQSRGKGFFSFLRNLVSSQDTEPTSALSKYIYIDLEVDRQAKIYRIGAVYESEEFDAEPDNTTQNRLNFLREQNFHVCGHNFRRFDYPHLTSRFPNLHPWPVIDTLELSVLFFPLERSQKLNKDYKSSDYARNNPLEDARATRDLLQKILNILDSKPQVLLNLYAYLLSCGKDEASQAYRHFFAASNHSFPDIKSLPPTATDGIDFAYLSEFITQAPTKDFDQRLCVAGIIAWNYESNEAQKSNTNFIKPPLGTWFSRFPDYSLILNKLRPIKFAHEFTYQPYLQAFSVPGFRGKQEEAVQAILTSQNPLVLMATGGGKSLCYQLPALMLSERQKGFTIVISPLQALMADQVHGLQEKGLNFATFINGNIRPIERRERLEQLRNGEKDLLYISPEQLRSLSIRTLLQERLPSLIVFDEAHCISQWGHDFRPDYCYAPKFIAELYQDQQRTLPLMAFMTATAALDVRRDIQSLFARHHITIHTEIYSSSTRGNLTYQILPTSKQSKEQKLIAEVKRALNVNGAVLIYTATRRNTENLAELLNENSIDARFYHGKISKEDKSEILQKFKDRELNVIVATCSFGMGIDRPDVRTVIHHTMSGSLEGYVQEAGRAGRDGQPATCTLLFDPQDADTAFFLQSLNQISEPEMRNIFIAIRKLRDQIHGKERASEESFWVTSNEIFQTSDLGDNFASETEQKDTKIKVALQYLEDFGMVERAENQSSYIEFELIHQSPEASCREFDLYAHKNNLSNERKAEFHRLILAMHHTKTQDEKPGESYPLEQLSDESGIAVQELKLAINELHKANICTPQISTTILIGKGVRGDAKHKYEIHQQQEQQIMDAIINLWDEQHGCSINCRALPNLLDPDGKYKLNSRNILEILEGWSFLKWIEYQKINYDFIRITKFVAPDHFADFHYQIRTFLDLIYEELAEKTGARLRLKQDAVATLSKINQKISPQALELEEIEKALAWLHRHMIIRLTDGLHLFHQSLKIRVIKGAQKDKITREYTSQVKPHYDEQTRRTHIMLDYGKHDAQPNPKLQEYISNYFSLSKSEFAKLYPNTDGEAAKRPVTQEDYDRIIGPLNPVQREIVLAEQPAISVIAGPGSGKTRTIVHRVAYLVKVKRVDPTRIIVLAYNRNAIRELRLRLNGLVGEVASRLRVYTFHGLALAILGRTVEEATRNQSHITQQNPKDSNEKFAKLIKNACDFLESSEDELEDEEENQLKITKLLGNCEYIFVDEYQDVAEDEYRLVKLIAGLQKPKDTLSSVQTNICVIGDDDQNIYEWRGTSTAYIRSFEVEYRAKQFLLTENYRSTEHIIAASNRLIQHNNERLKRKGDQQVRIDNARVGQRGLNVYSLRFTDDKQQAEYIQSLVKKWIDNSVKPDEIAILARQWEFLDNTRTLIERKAGISTYSLKDENLPLIRNLATQNLINDLKRNSNRILSKEESVKFYFEEFFERDNHSKSEPTVKTLLKIAEDIDAERGYGSEDLSNPTALSEIITTIYEFNESRHKSIEPDAILVTSCHGAKGLEFKNVILIADGFNYEQNNTMSERRLFYVAMTRAREKLILAHSQDSRFIQEVEATPYPIEQTSIKSSNSPIAFFADFTPAHVHLGFGSSRDHQEIIKQLKEGDRIDLIAANDNWRIYKNNQTIGSLSRRAVDILKDKGIYPGKFLFQPNEVTVRSVYRHLKIDEVNRNILEDWYVVIPQIRIYR